MPRLANDEKAGYYPLPDELPARIAALIYSPKQTVRGLDPCVGTGAAMTDLARQLNIMPYGIEIHEERAAEAAERLSTFHTDTGITPVIPGSYTETKISPQAFSLIYNNPPYVFVDDKNLGRAEYAWLRDTRPLLTIDGLMIWVVPRHMLNHRRAAGYLVSWFRDIQVYKFPEPLYNRFKQIIVFGVRRPHATIGDHEYIEKLRSMGEGGD